MSEDTAPNDTLITLTADIVAAHVSNNSVSVGDVASLIANVHAALSGLGASATPEAPRQEPAVSIRSSVKPDYIVCLEDGKKLKMLKRHLMTHYQMTPDDYRAKWGLPSDYPMVAPSYAATRKELALKIGLGRKPGETVKKAATPRGRKAKSETETA
jgi:predicted transcriptional regulator